jgi:diaminopimelate decarboxylase
MQPVTAKLKYKNGSLYFEEVEVRKIAEKFSTPVYVYSKNQIKENFLSYKSAFLELNRKYLICFAIKSNSNSEILKIIKNLGGGADITSGGELYRALKSGIDNKKIVYAGVGKTKQEIEFAIKNDILMFNVESKDEVELLESICRQKNKKVNIAVRVNPEVNTHTISYVSTGEEGTKFGIPIGDVVEFCKYIKIEFKNLNLVGLHFHIGSQICDLEPFVEATKKVVSLVKTLRQIGIKLRYLDVGGGLGIRYKDEEPPNPKNLILRLSKYIPEDLTIICEPGRSIVGNSGILICKVLYHKKVRNKNFLIVDASMTDLIRPAFYGAYHNVVPVVISNHRSLLTCDIVGPVCETSDFLCKNRTIPDVENGEYLVIETVGAYGFVMSSNYNSRLRPAEVMVENNKFYLVRKRDDYKDLVRKEVKS